MLRRFAIFLFLTLAMPSLALAQQIFVRDIVVEGNQRVSAETVRSYMRIEPGGVSASRV